MGEFSSPTGEGDQLNVNEFKIAFRLSGGMDKSNPFCHCMRGHDEVVPAPRRLLNNRPNDEPPPGRTLDPSAPTEHSGG